MADVATASAAIKAWFETGDVPTQQQFADFITSYANLVDNNYLDGRETGITAFAGGGQASAYQLTKRLSIVATVATTNDSVKVPAAVTGKNGIVCNSGANVVAVYPVTGEQFSNNGTNQALLLAVNHLLYYECLADGTYSYQIRSLVGTSVLTAVYNTSTATFAPDLSTGNSFVLTQQAVAIAIDPPTKFGVFGDRFSLLIKDNGTAQTITFNAAYVSMYNPIPAKTVAGKYMYLEFLYQSSTSKWYLVNYVVEDFTAPPTGTYYASMNQSGTSAPTVNAAKNKLNKAVAWSYVAVGQYRITPTGGFAGSFLVADIICEYEVGGVGAIIDQADFPTSVDVIIVGGTGSPTNNVAFYIKLEEVTP